MRKILVIMAVVFLSLNSIAQDITSDEMVKLKLELLDSELNLIQTKMKLFEKSKSERLLELDSLIVSLEQKEKEISKLIKTKKEIVPNCEYYFKSAITLNPLRLFEGSIVLSYERNINQKLSLDVSLMGSYVTKEGIGGMYFASQVDYLMPVAYYNESVYRGYQGEMITGFGILFEMKNYLKHNNKSPLGIYAAPQLMYRRVNIIGRVYSWDFIEKEVVDRLDVMKGGVVIGKKIKFTEVLCLDINVGGVMRISKYVNEKKTTKYKRWNTVDYSGILPTLNIKIGILK